MRLEADFKKVRQAVLGVEIPRIEYSLTQGECHRKNCQLHHRHGLPEEALKLIQLCILDDLEHLSHLGETKEETTLANIKEELAEFEEWKRSKGEPSTLNN